MKVCKTTGLRNWNSPHQREVQTLCRLDLLNVYDRTYITVTLNLLTIQAILPLISERSETYLMTLRPPLLAFVLIIEFGKAVRVSGTLFCSFTKISSWVEGRSHSSSLHWRLDQTLEKPFKVHGDPSTPELLLSTEQKPVNQWTDFSKRNWA